MHGPINVKFPNNISKWQMGFNSAFKGLIQTDTNAPNDPVSRFKSLKAICSALQFAAVALHDTLFVLESVGK
jgi:hypothetical protein